MNKITNRFLLEFTTDSNYIYRLYYSNFTTALKALDFYKMCLQDINSYHIIDLYTQLSMFWG